MKVHPPLIWLIFGHFNNLPSNSSIQVIIETISHASRWISKSGPRTQRECFSRRTAASRWHIVWLAARNQPDINNKQESQGLLYVVIAHLSEFDKAERKLLSALITCLTVYMHLEVSNLI